MLAVCRDVAIRRHVYATTRHARTGAAGAYIDAAGVVSQIITMFARRYALRAIVSRLRVYATGMRGDTRRHAMSGVYAASA